MESRIFLMKYLLKSKRIKKALSGDGRQVLAISAFFSTPEALSLRRLSSASYDQFSTSYYQRPQSWSIPSPTYSASMTSKACRAPGPSISSRRGWTICVNKTSTAVSFSSSTLWTSIRVAGRTSPASSCALRPPWIRPIKRS
jgi:hypothetical protein